MAQSVRNRIIAVLFAATMTGGDPWLTRAELRERVGPVNLYTFDNQLCLLEDRGSVRVDRSMGRGHFRFASPFTRKEAERFVRQLRSTT